MTLNTPGCDHGAATSANGFSADAIDTHDYCYDPNWDHLPPIIETDNGNDCSDASPCGLCEGDCDSDAECQAGLLGVRLGRY